MHLHTRAVELLYKRNITQVDVRYGYRQMENSEIENFCNIITVFINTFNQVKASLLNKSVNFYNSPPPIFLYNIHWLQAF